MGVSNRKKTPKSYAMDDYMIERIATLSNTGMYGSQSSIVSTAVAEFLARNESTIDAQKIKEINNHITTYLKSPEGEAVVRGIIRKLIAPVEEDDEEIDIVVE